MTRSTARRAARWLSRIALIGAVGMSHGGFGAADVPVALERMVNIDMPAQKVPAALVELSRQANVQIIMPAQALDRYEAPAIRGRMSVGTALKRVLGTTPHKIRPAPGNTVTIEVPAAATP